MEIFTAAELNYLRTAKTLARLATVNGRAAMKPSTSDRPFGIR